ncbi:hypothetical protein A2533_02535 [Candidatus Falkowbacteria bacterium RIFOXYD2_FULL_35_9]|uniref:Uncharacterized protein n=1 Tax=Candidatus Falkowbacteria bacterium RIFOXYC2_FULL_36_12 TaxID=1798002 RepID=A0A1F5T437_9BACT|nr:MAG: hypothetical protein A2300_02310 [Candidatus Falkowbacteria bacterium RIFOXYB2_FULL_35_7]OGF33476.1 MAG: hypothetical protein A2478_02175 [Candidatus Falkowbacteria bacterium RIFOXYC2_FULL_36_12]OGF34123.1 MAG: hypothetical protein A2223_01685 [Candidatus Falkowbacteria bacterium RIFOXYA2_FULL_35_8]OGF46853.1 MAG: hypothetical protein A2533_02535 [Candidatus Falkowbacteria bacterium RIFOXYD2_FULL_35_9]
MKQESNQVVEMSKKVIVISNVCLIGILISIPAIALLLYNDCWHSALAVFYLPFVLVIIRQRYRRNETVVRTIYELLETSTFYLLIVFLLFLVLLKMVYLLVTVVVFGVVCWVGTKMKEHYGFIDYFEENQNKTEIVE